MNSSLWRITHFILAVITSVFLLIASITGAILAIDTLIEKSTNSYKAENFNSITLAQSLAVLEKKYPEISEISIDHNQIVTLQGYDEVGENINAIVNPSSGKILGKPLKKKHFITQVTALHRSLFLHDFGRITVGIIAFLFFLITISGFVLILKRQKGISSFFSKINKDHTAHFLHVTGGRLFIIPMILISVTGNLLFFNRIHLFPEKEETIISKTKDKTAVKKNISNFEDFKKIKLQDVEKIEFPFDPDDSEDVYIVKLKDKILEVNQFSGSVKKETRYSIAAVLSKISLDFHTGRISGLLALVLAFSSIQILVFIYTGFVIYFRRTSSKIKNKYSADQAEYIILVGSENGTTVSFANKIQKQLLEQQKKAHICYLNDFREYKNARHLIVFTSTYGLGDPPYNGRFFETLINKHPQKQDVFFSVVGFGSTDYTTYGEFAIKVDGLLENTKWGKRFLELELVNNRSTIDFVKWTERWSQKENLALINIPEHYNLNKPKTQKLKVVQKSNLDEQNQIFSLSLRLSKSSRFSSGDLLCIYPNANQTERIYSIGKREKQIDLLIKLHSQGIGSQYLYQLKIGDTIDAKIMNHLNFNFPKNANGVAMIANGTGVAPFWGMMHMKYPNTSKRLYCGFRYSTQLTKQIEEKANQNIRNGLLDSFRVSFSREQKKQYVTDLIAEDEALFVDLLKHNGVIMLCGSLAMQRDVELLISKICEKHQLKNIEFYKQNHQIVADCY